MDNKRALKLIGIYILLGIISIIIIRAGRCDKPPEANSHKVCIDGLLVNLRPFEQIVVKGYVVAKRGSGGIDSQGRILLDVTRAMIYTIKKYDGSSIELWTGSSGMVPDPNKKAMADLYESPIKIYDHIEACGRYYKDKNMIVPYYEGEYIKTFPSKSSK